MNKHEMDILSSIITEPFINQRLLSESSGYSLGVVNRSINNLIKYGYLNKSIQPTSKAAALIAEHTPKRAIILAAGFGMRMVPINMERPKALLEIHNEVLIERIIRQLHEVNIKEIYIVVGFMKEQFEYLIDEFGVELIVNENYSSKNSLHSLSLVKDYLTDAYIIPCDLWCKINPFQKHELYSWYMIGDSTDSESAIRVNRKNELVSISENEHGNSMLGICYLLEEHASIVRTKLESMSKDKRYDGAFWEDTLYKKDKMIVQAKIFHNTDIIEINTYEQLRELDSDSNHLKSDAIETIKEALNIKDSEITNIQVLKKGMTNRSFMFTYNNKKYIMRIPGEGTDQLINRKEEAAVYNVINKKNICDDIVYINPANGYKITEFMENTRTCDPMDPHDLKLCMSKLRDFHESDLSVEHEFDIFKQIDFYESLRGEIPSVYRDYKLTKEKIFSLKTYIETHATKKVLTHIDAVPDNFLFNENEIRLIDWEYAGMQDPHVDIAMFCIYSLYDRQHIDALIDYYFVDGCSESIRIKIYCYIASCGLLWSNWCEYKRSLGVEFGEYSLRQYRYAKDYYKIVQEELKKLGGI